MKRDDITALIPDASAEVIDKIMNLNGVDINAAKTGTADLQKQLEAAQKRLTELEKRPTAEDLSALQTELDGLKASNALRDMRDAVAQEKGVPAKLLTADTKEACEAQAQSILDFAKSSGYPAIKDGGEPGTPPQLAPRDRFAAWAEGKL